MVLSAIIYVSIRCIGIHKRHIFSLLRNGSFPRRGKFFTKPWSTKRFAKQRNGMRKCRIQGYWHAKMAAAESMVC